MDLNTSSIFASVVFGAIGFAAFIYGKKEALFAPMIIGGALMIYPYCVKGPVLQWGIGAALTACLFIFGGR